VTVDSERPIEIYGEDYPTLNADENADMERQIREYMMETDQMTEGQTGGPTLEEIERHPMDQLLRTERLPHIWCPGCGLGTALSCFTSALMRSGLDLDKVSIVSGIGCTGRVAGYMRLDGFHTTHGRALPFATGLKLANEGLKVVVFSGDGDLIAIGGNHFIHAARRNMDITVVCVNNFIYGMTGGQVGPTTPTKARASTAPWGNLEHPFNIPNLASASGATYVARWTVLHARRLEQSIYKALRRPGFSVVEVISPCPTAYGRANRRVYGSDLMAYYHENAVIRHGVKPWEVDIGFGGEIICGEFVEMDRPTFQDRVRELYSETVQTQYRPSVELEVSEQTNVENALTYKTPLEVKEAGEDVEQVEVRLGGFGGQGIILSGKIVGRAVAIYSDRQVTLTRSYGPEARGGACSSAVIISDGMILYPHVTRPSLMMMMSQAAYVKYRDELVDGGLMLVDADLVEWDEENDQHIVPIPATRIAEEALGRRIVANIVMLGALTALTDELSKEAMEQAILDSVPKGTEDLNMDAFRRGFEYANNLEESIQ
jgi:2-oxoglutarate ferredoxin oxidoreductase subunit beta